MTVLALVEIVQPLALVVVPQTLLDSVITQNRQDEIQEWNKHRRFLLTSVASNNILLLPSKGTIGNRLILPKVMRIVSFWSLFGLGYFRNVIPHLILKL